MSIIFASLSQSVAAAQDIIAEDANMIECKIESIRISLMNATSMVVILKELDGERCLPLFIGRPDGDAIYYKLNNEEMPRPHAHDVAADLLEALDGKVARVLVREMKDRHYHASIFLAVSSGEAELDCRASDALAVAVRQQCPIYVNNDVMRECGVLPPDAVTSRGADDNLGAFSDFIGSLDLEDLDDDKNG
jgi:hypothetical protein